MCYTARASAVSFSVGLVGCLLLYPYDRALAAFFMFVNLMQLYDLAFWMHQRKDATNAQLTKLAMVSNHVQPLVLACLLLNAKTTRGSNELLTRLTHFVVLTYGVLATVYTIYAWRRVSYTLVTPVSAPSLYWSWNYLHPVYSPALYMLFLLSIILLFLHAYRGTLGMLLAGTAVVSFVLAAHYYKGKTAVGRFWCYFACFIPAMLWVSYHLNELV
jgi:hypothetical protein